MAFAMASTGHSNASLPDSTFILSGRSFHRIGSLLPPASSLHSYAQIYMLDADDAAARRVGAVNDVNGVLRLPVLQTLHRLLQIPGFGNFKSPPLPMSPN
jgi:hypothetical protein